MFVTPIYKVKLVQDGQFYSGHVPKYDGAPRNILPILRRFLAGVTQEHHVVITLDPDYMVTGISTTGIGSLTSVSSHPREVFKSAVAGNAYAIITCHSHPGNNPQPSDQDKKLHETLIKAADVMGILLLDDIIIASDGSYFSHTEKESHESNRKYQEQQKRLKVNLRRKIEKGSASRRDVVRLAGIRLSKIIGMVQAEAVDELQAIIADLEPITETTLRIRRAVRQRAIELLTHARQTLTAYKDGKFVGPSQLEKVLGGELETLPKPPRFEIDDFIVLPRMG